LAGVSIKPTTEAMLIIRPKRCLINPRERAFVKENAPRRLVFRTASPIFFAHPHDEPIRVTPALFTKISTRPASPRIFSAAVANGFGVSHIDRITPGFPARRANLIGNLPAFSLVRETQAT